MIGHLGLDHSRKQFDYYVNMGCEIIELGVPFSDPSADGLIIQNASKNALSYNIDLQTCMTFVESCKRKKPTIKLILMSYLNPIYAYGLSKFFANKFLDGVIIPDLPYESYDLIKNHLENSPIAFIPLLALDTLEARYKDILSIGSGFIYLMSLKGTTGANTCQIKIVLSQIEILKRRTELPVVVGFGIKSKKQVNEILKQADGVVMASQLIKFWENQDFKSLNLIFNK